MKKVFLVILLIIVVAIGGIAGYLKFALPDVAAAPDITITVTPERIARGAYLANHITVCMDCHSTRDWSRFTGPLAPETLGKGGEYFGREMGFPGSFYSKNITPQNLGSWTDGEIYRTITTGVNKNGEALFPVMPYLHYGKMDKEDVYDIIAYLRQLPVINSTIPERSIDFPLNFILNTIPANNTPLERPAKTDLVNYGHYIVTIAACIECHTQVKKGQIIPELAYAGGREFQMPNGTVRSANITPDAETGLGNWTEAAFIARFKAYTDTASIFKVTASQVNTIMPWAMYAGMDTTDLRAVYAYLKTITPINNKVEHFQLQAK
ncbi:cytochrome c [Agriterribacter sp.]|uniref:cytochrome c n=1 Tax=Agriterribacter sp. TaxID=2821509 RepID=UPI002C909DCF|nr:cytochrome c [Agriterribacter sp.]HRO46830.1 cytochrome c [Agriterribacter sp.]HRQ15561.1 cytochrome c [Agriterribacter sp.]